MSVDLNGLLVGDVKNDANPEEAPEGEAESDEGQTELQALQYPSNADDLFEMRLIDAVEKNQCIYNRCHPLHKMADYKSHIWSQVAKEVAFNAGPPVELERKWRHMRDRYVRLRKMVKTTQPMKKTDKWYLYYKKMSFLDPFVEHRNRRKRGELLTNVVTTLTQDALNEHADLTNEYAERGEDDQENSDSGEGEIDIDPLKGFYASFLANPPSIITTGEIKTEPQSSSAPHSHSSTRKRKFEEIEEDGSETEVSLFVRSISKTLSGMDAKTFALSRLEISRVLYECQYGKKMPV